MCVWGVANTVSSVCVCVCVTDRQTDGQTDKDIVVYACVVEIVCPSLFFFLSERRMKQRNAFASKYSNWLKWFNQSSNFSSIDFMCNRQL